MDDIKLLSLVEKNSYLYDKRMPEFKNKEMQQAAWVNIANSLEQDVDTVKCRWTYLRQKFSRERMKQLSGTLATEEWELMKYFQFLNPFVKGRKKFNNLKTIKAAESTSIEENNSSVMWDSMSISPTQELTEDEQAIQSPVQSCSIVASTSSVTKRQAEKRPLDSPVNLQLLSNINETLSDIKNKLKRPEISIASPEEIFGKFIASQLTIMTDELKKNKMQKICNILFENK